VSRFLTLIPYLAAQRILKTSAKPRYLIRTIQVTKSHGHICHEPVYSRLTVPNSAVSKRDGYVINASDTFNASDSDPVQLSVFDQVHTGSPIPEGFDAVVMHEDIREDVNGNITILKPARPGQNIQKAGSEIKTGEMIIPADHVISPEDIGAMIGYGITSVQVKKIVVGLIPTGDELKEPCTAPGPGEVIASNCEMLAASLVTIGIETFIYPIIPDDPKKIRDRVEEAVGECSFVIISGGSSTGCRDHTKDVLTAIGTILYHGVAMRPGKTTLAAIVQDIPVFGVPGTPAGALAVLRGLIIPWLSDIGYPVPIHHSIPVTLADSVPSELGTDDFVLMVVGKVGDEYKAMMVPREGGQISAVKSNAVLHIARNSEGIGKGKKSLVHMTRCSPPPDNIYLFYGMYDPILDVLDQYLRKLNKRIYVREASLESTLLSMQKNTVHGGIIIRPRNNGLNVLEHGYTNTHQKLCTITVADREYILAASVFPNYDSLKEFAFPKIPDHSFLYEIQEQFILNHQINPLLIERIEPECKTELEIVQQIIQEKIDFGPCSASLASEYDLFGPVIGSERIDLIVKQDDAQSEQINALQEILSSEEWRSESGHLQGYNLKRSGQICCLKEH
jgi:putative molybdopterin biosynthesis protein